MKIKSIFRALSLVLGLLVIASSVSFAQNNNKMFKKRDKAILKQLKQKAPKTARKEAKAYKKKGYYVVRAGLPMEKQLEVAYTRQLEIDEDGYPLYITATAESVAQTKIAAKNQAMAIAKFDLASQLETNIVGLIENSVANEQLSQEDAASLTKTVTASKEIVAQKLGRVITLFSAYTEDKTLSKRANVGYTVMIAYNQALALDAAKQTIKEELRDEAEDLHKKLDQILDF
jgi:hypothetical protein